MYGAPTAWFFFSSRPSEGVRLWVLDDMMDLSTIADLFLRCPAAGAIRSGVAIATGVYAMRNPKARPETKHINVLAL
jgi:hypothetical protein